MGRLGPTDRQAVFPRLQEEARARGGVPEVGRVEAAPLHLVAQRPERLYPGLEEQAALLFDRPFRLGIQRPPVDELGHVLHEDAAHVERRRPALHVPRAHAELIVDRLPATGSAMERALGRRHEEVERALGDDLLGPSSVEVDAVVARRRMVRSMRLDGAVPVVDRDEVEVDAKLAGGAVGARG
jgi:hypothetical protein